ncbi:AraC family transcriptional regulator [Paenibacillus marinisediminis]
MSETAQLTINHSPSKGELTVLFGGHSQTDGGHSVGPTILDYVLIHIVVSGSGTFTSRGTTYHLHKGDCFFIFPSELVTYRADEKDPWSYLWIAFRGTLAESLMSDIGVGPHLPNIHLEQDDHVTHLFRRVQQALICGGKMGDLEAEALLRLALVEISKSKQHHHAIGHEVRSDLERQVEEAVRYMTLRYNTPISIEQLAQQFGYHRTYFSKMFHEIMGETPIQMLIRLRMERARTLLITTKLPVEHIASSVGYLDALYFSKMYKRSYGESPTVYRKEHQIQVPMAVNMNKPHADA